MALVLLSATILCLDTLPRYDDDDGPMQHIEMALALWFTLELLVRILVWQESFSKMVLSVWMWIDFLAIVPFYSDIINSALNRSATAIGLNVISIMRILRLLRLLKLVRNYEGTEVLATALQRSAVALLVPLFFLVLMCFVFGGIVYYVEGVIGGNDEFGDIFSAAWFVLVTLSTVGYGDMAPETAYGRLVTAPIIITGVLFMAMPISIVGNNFTVTWEERDVMLLASKIQKLQRKNGLTEKDAVRVFAQFDNDGDGELDIKEFKKTLDVMGIALEPRQLASAFHAFDIDLSGTVSYEEFCDCVFPRHRAALGAVGTLKKLYHKINNSLDNPAGSTSLGGEDPAAAEAAAEAARKEEVRGWVREASLISSSSRPFDQYTSDPSELRAAAPRAADDAERCRTPSCRAELQAELSSASPSPAQPSARPPPPTRQPTARSLVRQRTGIGGSTGTILRLFGLPVEGPSRPSSASVPSHEVDESGEENSARLAFAKELRHRARIEAQEFKQRRKTYQWQQQAANSSDAVDARLSALDRRMERVEATLMALAEHLQLPKAPAAAASAPSLAVAEEVEDKLAGAGEKAKQWY